MPQTQERIEVPLTAGQIVDLMIACEYMASTGLEGYEGLHALLAPHVREEDFAAEARA